MTTLRGAASTIGLGVLLVLAGCVNTQARYEKAQDLESQGRYAEAAASYIKVLDKDPDWPEARVRLREVGARALAAYFEDARAQRDEGRYEDAVQTLGRLDALRADAEKVAVTLPPPDDYAAFRDDLNESALAALVHEGEQAEQRGDWEAALRTYQRADRYTDDPERLAGFAEREARVSLRWAEADVADEAYRAGFDRAQQVLDLFGPDHPLGQAAIEAQQAALEAGTLYVALLPFWRTEAVGREAPDAVVQDLNDVLLYDYGDVPPLFLALADPVQVRREVRRLRYERTLLTPRQAAQVGRTVEADYVVVGEWTTLERREKNVKDKTRKARLRGRAATLGGSRDTSYVEQRLTLELRADVSYRIIDPRTRRVVDQGTVDARLSGPLKRGVFAGDYRDLDLSGSALRLFEDEERLATEELRNELVDQLAERLAERLYDRLLRQLP